jgi:hypothetical protein
MTRRFASANGSDRSRTALTTLNIAVLVAIVNATVNITASENAGARRIVRSA